MSEIFVIIKLKTRICPWHMELYRSLFIMVEYMVVPSIFLLYMT
jgi:hypothetical protein